MKKNEITQLLKDYFSFTRSERKAILVLCIVLVFSVLFDILSDRIRLRKNVNLAEYSEWIEKLEKQYNEESDHILKLFYFDPNTIPAESLDTLDLPSKIKENLLKYRSKGGAFRSPGDLRRLYGMTDSLYARIQPYLDMPERKRLKNSPAGEPEPAERFSFDPNQVTEEELLRLGFNRYQVKNLLQYRSRGGKFRRKEDLMKVYGVDSTFYNGIVQWIGLMEAPPEKSAETGTVEKLPEAVELNSADSVALTRLPGIGPSYAGRIIRYRLALGGYYDPEQLLEVYGMTTENFRKFAALISVDTALIKPVRINFADIKTLNRHPYITWEQARKIVGLRSAEGPYASCNHLVDSHIFDEASFRKVSPYLSCQ